MALHLRTLARQVTFSGDGVGGMGRSVNGGRALGHWGCRSSGKRSLLTSQHNRHILKWNRDQPILMRQANLASKVITDPLLSERTRLSSVLLQWESRALFGLLARTGFRGIVMRQGPLEGRGLANTRCFHVGTCEWAHGRGYGFPPRREWRMAFPRPPIRIKAACFHSKDGGGGGLAQAMREVDASRRPGIRRGS